MNNAICPCIFIKVLDIGFSIVAIYMDGLNIIWNIEKINKKYNYLKLEFEIKELCEKILLGITKWILSNGTFAHQLTYI